MSSSKPTSVLIFLGACLAFAEALAGAVAALNKEHVSAITVLVFGTINLAMVLGVLVYMFWKNPAFLVAERADLVPLALLERIADEEDPRLVRELLKHLNWQQLANKSARLPEVREQDVEPVEVEQRQLAEALHKLRKGT